MMISKLLIAAASLQASGPTIPFWERYPKLECAFVRDQWCKADLLTCSVEVASHQKNTGYLKLDFTTNTFSRQAFTQGIPISEKPTIGAILSRVLKVNGQDSHAFAFLSTGAGLSFSEASSESIDRPVLAVQQLAAFGSPHVSVYSCSAG